MTPEFFFVYGTLQIFTSRENRWGGLLESSNFLGKAVTTDSFVMLDGGFPMIFSPDKLKNDEVFNRASPVLGQLYEVVDPYVVRRMDQIEGVPSFYRRGVTGVTLFDNPDQKFERVNIYITNPGYYNRYVTVPEANYASKTEEGYYQWRHWE